MLELLLINAYASQLSLTQYTNNKQLKEQIIYHI
jgi:hypothetical protein